MLGILASYHSLSHFFFFIHPLSYCDEHLASCLLPLTTSFLSLSLSLTYTHFLHLSLLFLSLSTLSLLLLFVFLFSWSAFFWLPLCISLNFYLSPLPLISSHFFKCFIFLLIILPYENYHSFICYLQ